MNGGIWYKLRAMLPQAADGLTAILSPSERACSICGRFGRRRPALRSSYLCDSCWRDIPWIMRIECSVCGRPQRCYDCMRRTDTAFICSRSAVKYDEVIRGWLALYKYRGDEALGHMLAELMSTAYVSMMRELSRYQPGFCFDGIVPVPVSGERLLERGFNQGAQLAAWLSQWHDVPVFDVLRRTGHSDKQSFKTRGARLRDTVNLFEADQEALQVLLSRLYQRSGGKQVRLLLVDDVYTTGSTANACSSAVAKASSLSGFSQNRVELFVLTLARS